MEWRFALCIRNAVGTLSRKSFSIKGLQQHPLFGPIAGGAGKPL